MNKHNHKLCIKFITLFVNFCMPRDNILKILLRTKTFYFFHSNYYIINCQSYHLLIMDLPRNPHTKCCLNYHVFVIE